MPELRWTLLILGALFIGGLALWELRRQRHARGEQLAQREGERVQPTFDSGFENGDPLREVSDAWRGEVKAFREPTLTFPEVTDRAPISNPPVMEVDDPSLTGLRVDSETAVDEFSSSMPEMSARAEPMVPKLSAADDEWQEKPTVVSEADGVGADGEIIAADPEDAPEDVRAARADEDNAQTDAEAARDAHDAADGGAATPSQNDVDDVEPIVDWPDEDVRKIIAFRLVSAPGERFAGRAVRMALAAEGFRLGKFEIFHKAGPDARAVLSAASLTKPGTFSLSTIDAQRYGGLSLFAVMPGPLSPAATFDELLTTARSLNDRLRGALQDERGEPLTPVRSTAIRDSLTAAATATAPVVGPPT